MLKQAENQKRETTSALINWGHWFAFFNGVLAVLIGFRYLSAIGSPEGLVGWSYFLASSFGHFVFLAFMIYLLFLFPATLLLPYSSFLRGFAAILASFAQTILLFDVQVFKSYGIHLSPFSFELAYSNLSSVIHGSSALLTLSVLVTIQLVVANWIWRRIRKIQKKNWGPKVVIAVAISFFGSHLVHIWADLTQETRITRQDVLLPLSYPATARSFMAEHGIEQELPTVATPTETQLNYPLAEMSCQNLSKPNNVLMVVVDGWRADMVDAETMPFFSQYAQLNRRYNQHYSGGSNARTGLFSILYGLQGNYIDAIESDNTPPVLSQVLTDLGYQLNWYSSSEQANSALQLANFQQHPSENLANQANTDKAIVANYLTQQPTHTAPWFNVVRLSGPSSYDTPTGYLGIATTKAPLQYNVAERILFNQYRQSLHALDDRLHALLAAQAPNTNIIITGINGMVFSSDIASYRNNLAPESVRVPLVMHWPQLDNSDVDYVTSHNGLVATLLSRTAMCSNPVSDYSSGTSLMAPSTQQWVYAGNARNFAIYQQGRVTVINRHGKYRIYDGDFNRKRDYRLRAKPLIEVMRETQRFVDK
ncbi:DUF3413 domain-containing protein [Paraferrimonas haliotis]|uniref:Sulfatase n=1 Tax=Paraferrimonas haliotis TaxID=2013866 RepID=A0AA37TMJ6_9GAMM|nr:DUF3413 domain-containing protein [Paraferrimonas haliotis]GLS84344.1 sulfatase [Paraferrimonas haliotis]